MSELCARPGCNGRAVATFTFDGLERIVWVNPLAEAAAFSAGDLCQRHADHMTAPRHWTLHDTRTEAEGALGSAGANAPSRYHPPVNGGVADEPIPAAAETRSVVMASSPESSSTPAPSAAPAALHPARAVHGSRLELRTSSARTPLLARAFRGATAG